MSTQQRRRVNCVVLGCEADGLDEPPIPGGLGVRIYNEVSREGWRRWLVQAQMIINERQLISADPHSFEALLEPMQQFLFEANELGTRPSGFRPNQD